MEGKKGSYRVMIPSAICATLPQAPTMARELPHCAQKKIKH